MSAVDKENRRPRRRNRGPAKSRPQPVKEDTQYRLYAERDCLKQSESLTKGLWSQAWLSDRWFEECKPAPLQPQAAKPTPQPAPPQGSPLAAFLRDGPDGMDKVVHSLVDDVVATMRQQECLHAVDLQGLKAHVNLEHRRKIVAWFVQAFHVVCFDDNILYGVVQLADRYLAACGQTVFGSELQGVVMACLCTTLKLETADFLPYSIPDLLSHITHKQISLQRVVNVERSVLTTLDFAATSPHIGQFMDVFILRLSRMAGGKWSGWTEGPAIETVVGVPSARRQRFVALADYLCQLALIHEDLAACRPSLLAASALLLSLHALDAPDSLRQVLHEDISLVWDLGAAGDRREVQTMVESLLLEWQAPVDPSAAQTVADKFVARGLDECPFFRDPADLSPPALGQATRSFI